MPIAVACAMSFTSMVRVKLAIFQRVIDILSISIGQLI